MDRYNRVIYVGSFAKSLFPGLRIGLIAADQYVENEAGVSVALIDEMVKVKAHLTNNTPTINQAMLGGLLLESGYSLREWSRPKFEAYRRKRDCMVGALHRHVGTYSREWAEGIRWNEPDGGFFLKLEVSFPVDDRSVEDCARRYGVIFCPMRYFYLENGGQCEIRLTFSNVTPENIELGVGRLAAWLKEETEKAVGARLEQVETFY